MSTTEPAPDYELHLPQFLTYPVSVITICIITGSLLYFLMGDSYPVIAGLLSGLILLSGIVYAAISAMLVRYTDTERRLKAREDLLDEIDWQGNEKVLDVGCGNGILTMGAARRLTSGEATGIDTWIDMAGGSRPEAFHMNAKIEGVADKVSLENEDVRKLPYDNGSFDVIISGLTMHHILHGGGADKAMSEMARVLKPGGYMAIYDVPMAVNTTARLMGINGLEVKKKDGNIVIGRKLAPVIYE